MGNAVKRVQEKIVPIHCVCGSAPVLVKKRGGQMYSCPNPEQCSGNYRTMWQRGEQSAAQEWNTLIKSSLTKNRGRKSI